MAPGGNPKKRKIQFVKNHTTISTPHRSMRKDGLTDSSPNLVAQTQTEANVVAQTQTEASVPQNHSTGHQTQSSGCQTQPTGLQSQSDIPLTESSTPQTESPTIETQTSVPETQDAGPAVKPRTRGPTMGRGLMKFLISSSGKKMKIEVDPLIGRPANRIESAKFSSQVGVVVRDVLPVPKKWKDVDVKTALTPCIDHMQIHMDVNVDKPGVKECLIDRIQSSSRQRRYRLHGHYKTYANREEAKKNVPKGCTTEQWDELCDYFYSPEFKNRSQANTKNRDKVRSVHITGQTAFSVIQNELNKGKGDGNEIEFYRKNHVKSVDTDNNLELMMKKKEEYDEEGIEKTEQEVVTEVLGQACGYVKGLGYGRKPPGKCSMLSNSNAQRIQQELEQTREELEKSKSYAADFESEVTDLRTQLAEQGNTLAKVLAFFEASEKNVDGNHEEDETSD